MTVLEEIIAGVREDLEARERALPLEQLKEQLEFATPALDVMSRLRSNPDLKIIAEVKRSSPSKGALAPIEDPASLAAAYERGGAAIISVLTEMRRFSGSLADLKAVRAAVSVPVLRKDFVVSEYQVWESRAWGADVVLLIVAALDDAQLAALLKLTESLGMTALVEAHTEAEIARAVAAGATLIGVNTRDLKTLDVDRAIFGSLVHAIPRGALAVAESGVRNAEDVADYAATGAELVLVGEALVTGGEPEANVRDFIAAGSAARQQATYESTPASLDGES
ncbi:indole-3-glycerol phosphate synthase TrpC [Saxibacter everestensis]|uniref:Indole-3-glycerol phosphate synthase n=1 Tax=Saxibacter everestensis TaxID=2909229 RepID=A0ABY8R0U3_9MICO|nr:indole-3-glycerol phosphate synthase TrpC [Brevibacteriaceae bacterium ZFBP1038]